MPSSLVEDTIPVLVDILRDVPYIDFDRCLAWDGALNTSAVKIDIHGDVLRLGTSGQARLSNCFCSASNLNVAPRAPPDRYVRDRRLRWPNHWHAAERELYVHSSI